MTKRRCSITIDTLNGVGTAVGINGWPGLEYIPGGGSDCNGNFVPDVCEILDNDCNTNGLPDECDILGATGSDCNMNAILDECEGLGDSDFDNDGLINLRDHLFFADCLGGPGAPLGAADTKCGNTCSAVFDSDGDNDIDLFDYGDFARLFLP